MFNHKYVLNKIKKSMPAELFDHLVESKAMLIGGCLTSILTNNDINDFDIYFKSKGDLVGLLIALDYKNTNICHFTYHTDKSITFSITGTEIKLQLIHQEYYTCVNDVFIDFDFTINMLGYDFEHDLFFSHDHSMQHLSQRQLIINPKTKFPLISVLRVSKYVGRGYSISKKEMLKLLLSVNDLNMSNYDDVIKQLGGMYGINVEKVFDRSVDFSIKRVIDQLDEFDFDTIVDNLNERQDYHKFLSDFCFFEHLELLKSLPYFKGVLKCSNSGGLKSEFDESFTYPVGEWVMPRLPSKNYCSRDNIGIYAVKKPISAYKGDTLICLLDDPQSPSFNGSCFKGKAFVEGIVLNDYTDRSGEQINKIAVDYLYLNGYITNEQRGVVFSYYESRIDLDYFIMN